MTVNASNPLFKHFRQPSIFTRLPSQGKYWRDNSIDLPVTGEIPVFPMTAKDEIILRTPDALMNGQGVVDVIQSCCPSIKDAWSMPSIDVDAVLISIRIASYGNQMDVELQCPYCTHQHEISVDLSVMLDNITAPNYNQKIEQGTIRIKLQPQTYFSINKTNKVRFEEQRIIDALTDSALDEEVRLAEYAKHLKKIVEMNLDMLVNSTEYIETTEGDMVTNPDFIREFYVNCDANIVRTVEAKLQEIAKSAGIKPIENACPECTKQYSLPMEFDYARFFAKKSPA